MEFTTTITLWTVRRSDWRIGRKTLSSPHPRPAPRAFGAPTSDSRVSARVARVRLPGARCPYRRALLQRDQVGVVVGDGRANRLGGGLLEGLRKAEHELPIEGTGELLKRLHVGPVLAALES